MGAGVSRTAVATGAASRRSWREHRQRRFYWEVVIKTQKGLLTIADLPTWWRRATDLTAARVLPIRASHVTALAALPILHKDPFDRILLAQVVAEGLDFVTNDEAIAAYVRTT